MFRLPPEPEIAAGLTILLDKYLAYSAMIAEIEAGLKKSNIDIKTFLGVDPATLSGMGFAPWIRPAVGRIIELLAHIGTMIWSFVITPEKHHKQTMKLQRKQFERELEERKKSEEKQHQDSLELMKKQMEMQAQLHKDDAFRQFVMNLLLDSINKRQDLAETRKQVEETIKALGEVESSDLKKIIQGLYPAIDSAFKEAEKLAETLKKGRASDQGRPSDRGASESKDVSWNTIAPLVVVLVGIPLAIYFLKRK
jgi:transketolase